MARRWPSNPNGLVTTAIVRAPSSVARLPTIGAAPVPVPPPRPAVTKTISAPSKASTSLSVSSSAARRPISGSPPAPSPRATSSPSWILTDAFESFRDCRSVFATMNSTPSRPSSIRRLTALPPAPPTPITLMFEPCPGSRSAYVITSDLSTSFSSVNMRNLHLRYLFRKRRRGAHNGHKTGLILQYRLKDTRVAIVRNRQRKSSSVNYNFFWICTDFVHLVPLPQPNPRCCDWPTKPRTNHKILIWPPDNQASGTSE